MNFNEKIVKLQSKLKAPKNQYNSFGKYKYRSCEDIVEGVKPLTSELGLILLITDELVLIGERYYIKATAKLTDGENSIESVGLAREPDNKKGMDSSQLTGSTSSYARKYALNGLLAIDDTKDADDTNKHGEDDNKPKTSKSDKVTTQQLIDMGKSKGISEQDILKLYAKEHKKVSKVKFIPQAIKKEYYNRLEAK